MVIGPLRLSVHYDIPLLSALTDAHTTETCTLVRQQMYAEPKRNMCPSTPLEARVLNCKPGVIAIGRTMTSAGRDILAYV